MIHITPNRPPDSKPISTPPHEAKSIAAQISEYDAISTRPRAETEGWCQRHPHQWAGMNSNL